MDGRHGVFDRVIRGDALHGLAEDGTRSLVRFCTRAGLGIADDGGAFKGNLVLEVVEQLLFRLFGRHPRNIFEAAVDLELGLVELALLLLDLALQRRDLMLALVERISAAVERFFALLHAMLCFAHLALAFLALGFDFGPHLQSRVLGLDLCFALDGVGLATGIRQDGFRFLGFLLGCCVCHVLCNDEAKDDADDDCNDCGYDCCYHRISFLGLHACKCPMRKHRA